ncbi:MAG TPA: hypothetical protein VD886_05140 [Herpetosiphonaceae bacterium]|nr:hypothetical protein [Herpetosiphonaceae bacterium]
MDLFHFSEDGGIGEFVPRQHPVNVEPPYVWAVDDAHGANYLLPRDCPRICIAASAETTDADRERFFGHGAAERIIVVESGWLAAIRAATLYRYALPAAPFQLYDQSAGYYVSPEPVAPLAVTPIADLLAALLAAGVELRLTPSLWPLQRAVAASSLEFSMIRMRNAAR